MWFFVGLTLGRLTVKYAAEPFIESGLGKDSIVKLIGNVDKFYNIL